jgi:spore maturation protein CgeB
MNIAFFGSSLLSAYWNGAATYYRGIIRALYARGHRVTFYEPDAYNRQAHRDIDPPDWAQVVVYANERDAVTEQLEAASAADLVVKASGVGVFDEYLEREVLALQSGRTRVVFWDVDAPATLERMQSNPKDPFIALVPQYDSVFTYGGGDPVVSEYLALGAQTCVPIYNALDPSTHHPVRKMARFEADLSFLGNRLPDREARVEEFFFKAADRLPGKRFLLGGSGWDDKQRPANVEYLGHVPTNDHNAWNCSAHAVLNVSRSSMARYGFSPATRVFEAAGTGACIITDEWEGIEIFFEPGSEILVASSGEHVAEILAGLTPEEAAQVGQRAYRHVLAEHTYAQRAELFEQVIGAPIYA